MNPWTLLIDTSVRGLALGILDLGQRKIIDKVFLTEHSAASHFISDSLLELCEKNNRQVLTLNSAICGSGPGSFTGIRIGLSFLYGLSANYPTFRFFSYSLSAEFAKIIRQPVCLASTKDRGFISYPDGHSELSDLQDILKLENCTIISPWDFAVVYFQNQGKKFAEISLVEVLSKVWNDFETRELNYTLEKPVPLYLRQSTAEENR